MVSRQPELLHTPQNQLHSTVLTGQECLQHWLIPYCRKQVIHTENLICQRTKLQKEMKERQKMAILKKGKKSKPEIIELCHQFLRLLFFQCLVKIKALLCFHYSFSQHHQNGGKLQLPYYSNKMVITATIVKE